LQIAAGHRTIADINSSKNVTLQSIILMVQRDPVNTMLIILILKQTAFVVYMFIGLPRELSIGYGV